MTTFAVITLVSVLIILTHLHNWALRVLCRDTSDMNGTSAGIFIISVVYIIVVIFIIKYIIIWGQNLV
jgi:hypothetical protein